VLKDPYQFDFLTRRQAAHERDVSIGLILCHERNRVVVEYALRGVDTPIGVARYQLMLADTLPAQLAEALPSPRELEPGMLPDAGGDHV
jgi:hypothetical protein